MRRAAAVVTALADVADALKAPFASAAVAEQAALKRIQWLSEERILIFLIGLALKFWCRRERSPEVALSFTMEGGLSQAMPSIAQQRCPGCGSTEIDVNDKRGNGECMSGAA